MASPSTLPTLLLPLASPSGVIHAALPLLRSSKSSMEWISSPYFDPDYENLAERIFGPSCRVCINNECCENCTVVTVDSENKEGILLDVVQVLTDADLYISKSYVSSDAKWFMDGCPSVNHLADEPQASVPYPEIPLDLWEEKPVHVHMTGLYEELRGSSSKMSLTYLTKAIGARKRIHSKTDVNSSLENVHGTKCTGDLTAIEMAGTNRPGLFSEISAILADLRCNIVEAHAWSHNTCLACVAYVSDESTSGRIEDPNRLATIKDHLSTVLCPHVAAAEDNRGVKTGFPECECSMTDSERRLHQMMLANEDFDEPFRSKTLPLPLSASKDDSEDCAMTLVSIDRCSQRRYSVINIQCLDRQRLMFDIVCTLTDLQYFVFHASVACHGPVSHQEYFIRHKDGYMLCNEHEQEKVKKCLEAAIERRICGGVRMELCARNRVGLVPYVTRVLAEYGLTVARADIETQGDTTMTAFHVQDVSGNRVNMDVVESISKKMEPLAFEVKNEFLPREITTHDMSCFSFGSMLHSQMKFSDNFISI